MDKRKIYQSILFFVIGISIFLFVYRNTGITEIVQGIQEFKWHWIAVSIGLNILSQLVRAIRWKLLFTPLKFSPKIINLFIAVLIMAFTNQIIPRGGEIARLGIITKYEKVPFANLLGIALVERLTDLCLLLLIFLIILIWQFPLVKELLALPAINLPKFDPFKIFMIIIAIALLLSLGIILFKKLRLFKKFKSKIHHFLEDVCKGLTSIMHIKNKFLYFFESVLIYVLWLGMLYVLFYAYPPTSSLSFKHAAFVFGLATMAFLLPIQAGMGAWHFVVIQCLLLLGVESGSGKIFALVAHAATNLIYLVFGIIAFSLLPWLNSQQTRIKLSKQIHGGNTH